ncbi:L-lactate dehydrogenase complex protein LldG [Catenuloplanes nepalensis]|uniref:L-lactate dehydrogenase complex protein LldG n=1 Tax=Catenuloplanes nepalensis TaxID=587533 RepID=A0ABT9N7U8_9ACTN|nr:LUD domain-containing protein [Catenuloplanes nepalensis]MDP9799772.1 L-lactate dehydrogenase complex protein LldG [Catenuloplanes nepalensis]
MSDARTEILARVRAARPGSAAPVPRDYRRDVPGIDVVEVLVDRLVDYKAGVHRAAAASLADVLGGLLATSSTVVVPPGLPASWLTGPVLRDSVPVLRDSVAEPISVATLDAPGVTVVTGAAVAIAATGTLILDAGPDQGRRVLSLVPDHHVCVVWTDQILGGVPAALGRLPDPTRPLTLISGPSATSDIELNRVEGVHGPRRLDVVIVER